MKIIIIDPRELTDKTKAHEYVGASLNFPDYYGKNLDALADCLAELPRDTAVIVKGNQNVSEYAVKILTVFDEILGNGKRIMYI